MGINSSAVVPETQADAAAMRAPASTRASKSRTCAHDRALQDCATCSGCPHMRGKHGCDLCALGIPALVKLRALNLSPVYAALILNGARKLEVIKDGETRDSLLVANLEGEIVLIRTTVQEYRKDAYPWRSKPAKRNDLARALAQRVVACNPELDEDTAFRRMRCDMPTGSIWFLAEIGKTAGVHEHLVMNKYTKAELQTECTARGISYAKADRKDKLKDRLREFVAPTEPAPPLRTCVADKAKWETKIERIFPLRRSIALERVPPFCEQGVFVAEIPSRLLPRRELGEEGLRHIAVLSSSLASRPTQMRHRAE
jgi:hypothetical protein